MDVVLRKRHLRVWLVLGPVLVAGVAVLLLVRPAPVVDPATGMPIPVVTGEQP